jgi:hypothetical protein
MVKRMSGLGVRREKAALSSGCKTHPAAAPAGSNRSSHGGDEKAEAFGYIRRQPAFNISSPGQRPDEFAPVVAGGVNLYKVKSLSVHPLG